MAKSKQKTVQTKQEIEWYIVDYFLECMRAIKCLQKDKEFHQRFSALSEYVIDKLALPIVGEITDTFVLVKQKVTDEE